MGHGTSPEKAPVHQRDGIYVGMTTWSMPGDWVQHLEPQIATGPVPGFVLTVDVAEGSGHDHGDHDHTDDSMGHDNKSNGHAQT